MALKKDKVTSLRSDASFLVQYANATETLPDHCIAYLTERSLRNTYFPVAAYRYDAKLDELLIPYPTTTNAPSEFGRRRVFTNGSTYKFRQDKGSGNHFYLAPIPERYELDWASVVSDRTVPLYICEGEVKAGALAQHGHCAVGIAGVYSWLSDGKPIADFDLVDWRHREVTVITDADAGNNRNVQTACVRVTEELCNRGATVFVWVPRDCDVDEMLAAEGIRKVRAAIKRDRVAAAEIKDWGLTDQQPTDTGAGNVFVDLHGDIVRYCPERRSWFVKADHLWREDKQGAAIELGKATAREMQRQALRMPSGDERNALFKDSIRRENIVPLKNMLEAASTNPDIVVPGASLDANPNFIGVLNGVLNLADGEFLPQCPDGQYITKSLGVAYDAGRKPPRRFLKFLRETFGKDEALVRYLQKSIGYALSGTPNEQKFFV